MILNVGNITPNGAVLDDAIIYAVDNGADIIQMSLGVAWSQAIEAAIDDAYNNHNVLLVCASGNDSSSTVNFPSSDQNVIAVGSTSANDTKSSFSNYGADLEIAAPGENIYTTTLNNGYGNAGNGTSFAAPQVSATASLLLSIDQNLTPDEIRTILHNTADKVGGYNYNWNQNNPGHSLELGFGRLNVANAISFVFPTINGPTLVCSSGATFIVNNLPSGCTVSWTASPTNLFTVTSGSGNTFTTSWSGGFRVGYGTITATISSNCSNIIISKNAWMGKPLGPSSIERLPDYVCIGPEYYYEVGVLHLYPETVTSWDWDLQPPGIIIGSQTGSLLRFYYPNGTNPNSYSMGVSAINSCGQSGYRTAYFDVNDCGLRGALSFELFPNPASENVQINISFDQDPILKSQNTLSTYTVSIMNMFGATMYMSNQSGTQFTIPLNGLKDGNYIIDIYNTDNKSLRGQKTLIINH